MSTSAAAYKWDQLHKGKRLIFPDGSRIEFALFAPGPRRRRSKKEQEQRKRAGWGNVKPVQPIHSTWDAKRYKPAQTMREMERAFERSWAKVPADVKNVMAAAWKRLPQEARYCRVLKTAAALKLLLPGGLLPDPDAFQAWWGPFTFCFPIQFWPAEAADQEALFLRLWAYHFLTAYSVMKGLGITKRKRLRALFLHAEIDRQLDLIVSKWDDLPAMLIAQNGTTHLIN